MYDVQLTNDTIKTLKKIKNDPLFKKISNLVEILKRDPYELPYEKLSRELKGCFSRRINLKHRLVYEILEEQKIVKILSVWTHYDF